MLKKNKGVTLISLAVTIFVMITLAGLAINAGYGTYQEMLVAGYVAKMNMVQARVNIINEMVQQGDTSYEDIGTEINELSANQKDRVNSILEGSSSEGFKYYDKEALAALGVEKIDEELLINIETRIIYSMEGVQYNDATHYNQYNLPNGAQVVNYESVETTAPQFKVEKDNYGLTTTVNITNIIYDEQINGSKIYYGEVIDNTTNPVTVKFWQQVQGTSFSVTKTATYAVKVIDMNGGESIKTVEVVTCNAPEITEGMVPVVYEEGNWKRVDDSEIGKWYDYAEGKWANVMLSDGLEIAEDGTVTTMGSMFVWIPRYAYQITSNYHNGGLGVSGNINVRFLKNLTYITTEEITTKMVNASGEGNWNVHPAFTDGSKNDYANGGWDKELSGFWVAKFEASSSNPEAENGGGDVTTLDVKVVPNVTSWRNISITNIFTNCLNMSKSGNIYGIPSNAVTHLMKNSEWGAVAYLAHSKYGRNGVEVSMNNSSTYITGNAGSSITELPNLGGVTNAYDTISGVLASTTGTIYGIYDMSGGSWERVAAGWHNVIEVSLSEIEGFSKKLVDQYSKVSDLEYDNDNYEGTANRYGDALYETSKYSTYDGVNGVDGAWNKDWTYFLGTRGVWIRGNRYLGGNSAGVFAFSASYENADTTQSFRPTIVIE